MTNEHKKDVDLQPILAELDGLLQVTSRAFDALTNPKGGSLKIFEDSPTEALDHTIELQDQMLQKMGILEVQMVKMKDKLTQPKSDPEDDHPSLFGPT